MAFEKEGGTGVYCGEMFDLRSIQKYWKWIRKGEQEERERNNMTCIIGILKLVLAGNIQEEEERSRASERASEMLKVLSLDTSALQDQLFLVSYI